MAHLAGVLNLQDRQNEGISNNVPNVITKYINQSISDDDPKSESDDETTVPRKKVSYTIVGDVRVVDLAFSRLRIAEYCNAYLGLLGIGVSIIERETRYVYGKTENDGIRIVLLSFNLLITILLLISLYFSYKMQFNWMKARGFLSKNDDLVNTGMHWYLIAELIVCAFSPLPFIPNDTFSEYNVNYDVDVTYWYNDLLLGWSFIRIYLVIRCILANCFYMSTRGQRVCQMNGCQASYMFAIKSLMKEQPYLVFLVNMIISMLYFGYLIRIFDQDLGEESGQNFDKISNPMWMSIVTMTTVGYGDFYPKSTISRIVGIYCSFYGVFMVSLFVVALENLLLFDQSEVRSYELVRRLEDKEDLKLEAVNVITSAFRHKKAKRTDPDNKAHVLGKLKVFRKYLMNFQHIAKSIRGNYGAETPSDRIRKEIDDLRACIDTLHGSLKGISHHFGVEMLETKPTGGIYYKGSTDDSDNKKNK